jgi:hypothetical protein
VNARDYVIRLGKELDDQDNAAHDLWTWLPSYREAGKWHGDHSGNYRPPLRDILVEATLFITAKCAPTAAELQSEALYQCPCDDPHV